jgi:hypothetical protein
MTRSVYACAVYNTCHFDKYLTIGVLSLLLAEHTGDDLKFLLNIVQNDPEPRIRYVNIVRKNITLFTCACVSKAHTCVCTYTCTYIYTCTCMPEQRGHWSD